MFGVFFYYQHTWCCGCCCIWGYRFCSWIHNVSSTCFQPLVVLGFLESFLSFCGLAHLNFCLDLTSVELSWAQLSFFRLFTAFLSFFELSWAALSWFELNWADLSWFEGSLKTCKNQQKMHWNPPKLEKTYDFHKNWSTTCKISRKCISIHVTRVRKKQGFTNIDPLYTPTAIWRRHF